MINRRNIILLLMNIFYIFFVGLLLFWGNHYEQYLRTSTLKKHFFLYLIYTSLFPVIVGIILGFPEYIAMYKQSGKWKIDILKLISFGLPTLYVTLMPALYYLPYGTYLPFGFLILQDLSFQKIAGIILGYLLIRVIKKEQA